MVMSEEASMAVATTGVAHVTARADMDLERAIMLAAELAWETNRLGCNGDVSHLYNGSSTERGK